MAFYKEIEKIVNYLKSIRKMEKYLSFDMEFPNTWRIPKKYAIEGKVVEQEKTNPGTRLISFIAELTEEETNKTISNITMIVDYNKELEEKEGGSRGGASSGENWKKKKCYSKTKLRN